MKPGREVLYLCRDDVAEVAPDSAGLAAAVRSAFADRAGGRVPSVAKTVFATAGGSVRFLSMPAVAPGEAFALHKWVGLSADNAARGLPHLSALIVLSDAANAMPVAILDGTWITAERTAAVTRVAAGYLAKSDCASLGLIGCGDQALSHLRALTAAYPLRRVVAYSRRRESIQSVITAADVLGLEARIAEDPEAAVKGQDLVVTSIPSHPDLEPFLALDWLSEGAFASLVDLGRSWRTGGFGTVDLLFTDDRGQSEKIVNDPKLPFHGPFQGDLADLVGGGHSGRSTPTEHAVFLHPGAALSDAAIATDIVARARAAGVGTYLPL